MSLVVTGSIGIDTVDTPEGSARNVLGGSCTYFAAGASFFAPVRIVAAVGEDFPEEYLQTLDHFKVDRSGLERRAGSKTFRWHGRYHVNMNLRDTVAVEPNVLAEPVPPVPAHFCDSRFVFLANTHPAGQAELLQNFKGRALVVADTMDLWINHERPALFKVLKQVDGLVLNDTEAQLLTGQANVVAAAEDILNMGPQFVIVKKGEHGAVLQHRLGRAVLPAFPSPRVIDPTGAGDSFAGGIMGYIAATLEKEPARKVDMKLLRRAIAYGTVLASYTIEAFSLERLKQIKRADLDKRLEEYRGMVGFE